MIPETKTAGPMEQWYRDKVDDMAIVPSVDKLAFAREQDAVRAELLAALVAAAPAYCETYCPREPSDGRDWVHEDDCDSIRAAIANARGTEVQDAAQRNG